MKDASATAIYGARGANGVVVITTKSGGKEGKATVTFASSLGYYNEDGMIKGTGFQRFSGSFNALKDDPLIEVDTIGLKGSPTNVFKSFTPPQKGAGTMLTGDDTAAQLAGILAKKHLI